MITMTSSIHLLPPYYIHWRWYQGAWHRDLPRCTHYLLPLVYASKLKDVTCPECIRALTPMIMAGMADGANLIK